MTLINPFWWLYLVLVGAGVWSDSEPSAGWSVGAPGLSVLSPAWATGPSKSTAAGPETRRRPGPRKPASPGWPAGSPAAPPGGRKTQPGSTGCSREGSLWCTANGGEMERWRETERERSWGKREDHPRTKDFTRAQRTTDTSKTYKEHFDY